MVFLVATAAPAALHVVLAQPRAGAGSYYNAVFFRGCSGSPTNLTSVQAPEGVSGIKPMPKPDW